MPAVGRIQKYSTLLMFQMPAWPFKKRAVGRVQKSTGTIGRVQNITGTVGRVQNLVGVLMPAVGGIQR